MVIKLRDVEASDLPAFFEHQKDPIANHMAAFAAEDPADWSTFHDHWTRILGEGGNVIQCITLPSDLVVGYVSSFEQFGEREVSYWVDRAHWNKRIATEALLRFLPQIATRPLYARAAKDNVASRRVLEKCGFVITGEGSGFANARQADTEEWIFTLS